MAIYEFDKVDSTNDEIKKLKTINDWDMIIAKEQTNGRGRMGRTWFSPEGGVYMSIAIKNDDFTKDSYIRRLPLVAGAAVLLALKELGKGCFEIKWPNDIYINDKKLGGILVEEFNGYFIVGIGINVDIENFEDLNGFATSLKREGIENIKIYDMAMKVYKMLEELHMKFIQEEWTIVSDIINTNNYLYNKTISFEGEDGQRGGVAKGIDEEGMLEVVVDGDIIKAYAGEIKILDN